MAFWSNACIYCWRPTMQIPVGWRLLACWRNRCTCSFDQYGTKCCWDGQTLSMYVSGVMTTQVVFTLPTGSTTRLTSEIIKNQLGAAALDRSVTGSLCCPAIRLVSHSKSLLLVTWACSVSAHSVYFLTLPDYADLWFSPDSIFRRRDTLLVRVPDWWLKGGKFESWNEWRENFLLQS